MKENKSLQLKVSLKQRIALVLFGLSLFFVLIELGLRLGGFAFLSLQEYKNRISIKQKGAYRIICLGESTTQFQYPHFLEEVLNQRNIGIRFSVIDNGIGGTDTPAILSRIESYLDEYHPDMVVAMMGINDWGNHIPYERPTLSKTMLFIRSLRTYKLARLLWLHMVTKAKEAGLYKLRRDKHPAQGRQSNIRVEGRHTQQESNIKNEDVLKKNLKLNPRSDKTYVKLGRLYRKQRQFPQAEKCYKKALELNPGYRAYVELGWLYRNQRQFLQAEECYKKALEFNPGGVEAYVDFGWLYQSQRQFPQAEECYKKAMELNPGGVMAYGALAVLYSEMGRPELAKEYAARANELRSKYCSPVTVNNYHRLKEILDRRGIKLVCAQYPMLSIEPLKRIFAGQSGVIFVDNEKSFKEAVSKSSYKEYFIDMFGGYFGHCTIKGNRLLAENIANVILKEVFHE